MDLEKYLNRIKFPGPLKTDCDTLAKLCECHLNNVPFETLDMFGGPRKVLDLEKIYNDLVVRQRGGFCYENNGLFAWLLSEIGFEVKILQAQSWVKQRMSYDPMFDHMLLMVRCDDATQWLADVGWGGQSFKYPLRFVEDREQTQLNGKYRISKWATQMNTFSLEKLQKQDVNGKSRKYVSFMNAVRGYTFVYYIANFFADMAYWKNFDDIGKWEVIFKFDAIPRKFEDFTHMCDVQQNCVSSFLKHNTLCSLHLNDGSVSLWGWTVRIKKYVDSTTEELVATETAENQQQLKHLLKKYFNIEVDFKINVQNLHYK